MKKFFYSSFVLVCSLLALSCNKNSKKDDKPLVLIMDEVNPPDTIVGRMDYAFKEKVEELSEGKIIIDLHTNGELGNNEQTMAISAAKNLPSSYFLTHLPTKKISGSLSVRRWQMNFLMNFIMTETASKAFSTAKKDSGIFSL